MEDGSDDDDDWENYKFDELKEVVDVRFFISFNFFCF